MKKISDLISESKLAECLGGEAEIQESHKTRNKWLKIFAIVGVIAVVAGAAYALYRYFKPDYLEDYEDDYEDDYDYDFQDDYEA